MSLRLQTRARLQIPTVHELEFRHDSLMTFYINWVDPAAYDTMQATTARVANASESCRRPCSTAIDIQMCCSDIYLPSFSFRNAFGFSQDRQVVEAIYFKPEINSVTWEVQVGRRTVMPYPSALTRPPLNPLSCVLHLMQVHGSYFHNMRFDGHPFDYIDLLVDLRFVDQSWMVQGHPGVQLVASSLSDRVSGVTQPAS